jgi:DNA helicase-2/ATP-dependent DNA helicase PcrA
MQTTIFGPPGTGKTTKLISIVKQELEDGTRPEDIAFVSFSRKAADEARTRASSALNMNPDEMVWFRTLHSLAFQFLGIGTKQVLRGTDFRQLGDILGLEFSSNSSLNMADGQLFSPGKGGDAYLSMIQLARVREISIEQQFNDTNDRRLHYQQLKLVDEVLRDYKRDTNKLDFVDMIDRFIVEEQAPRLEVLIVDEAQDLAPIQWRMVHDVLKPRAKRIYFAGDDDQCIYSWMGVDVRDFLNASENKMVLDKSYRLPRNVYDIAESLINRVVVRQPKVWSPVSEAGQVVWHHDIMDLNFSSGEWLILARTNYIANKIATDLKEQGYLFWREGSGWSISPNVLTGIEVWLKLCKGLTATAMELKTLSTLLRSDIVTKSGRKNLATLDNEIPYALDDVKENFCTSDLREKPWYEVLKVAEQERIYITSVRRMGEKILTDKPRVKISTIHKAKGGEADNVALVLDTSRACAESRDQDSEIRTFYVGMTRAKKALHLIEKQTRYGFVV